MLAKVLAKSQQPKYSRVHETKMKKGVLFRNNTISGNKLILYHLIQTHGRLTQLLFQISKQYPIFNVLHIQPK